MSREKVVSFFEGLDPKLDRDLPTREQLLILVKNEGPNLDLDHWESKTVGVFKEHCKVIEGKARSGVRKRASQEGDPNHPIHGDSAHGALRRMGDVVTENIVSLNVLLGYFAKDDNETLGALMDRVRKEIEDRKP